MRESMLVNRAWASVTPPEPAEAAISATGWRRTGLLQRLVKAEPQARALAVDDRRPTEELAARRAA
jgi:hypothetical protein